MCFLENEGDVFRKIQFIIICLWYNKCRII